MSSPPEEERYPLLLFYVEQNGKKSEFPQRVVFADKGRGKAVFKGAAAIITQWPAQVTSCWLTSIALGSSFIFFALILLMSSLNPMTYSIHPRCTRDISRYHGNKTVHLVKLGSDWDRKQLDVLKFVAETYPDYEVRITVVESSMQMFEKPKTNEEVETRTERMKYMDFPDLTNTFLNKFNVYLSQDTKPSPVNSLEMGNLRKNNFQAQNDSSTFIKRIRRSIRYNKPIRTYNDILKVYTNVKERKTTFKIYFMTTPLQYFWMDLNSDMVVFAMRVQELWQDGGISFHMPVVSNKKASTNETLLQNSTEINKADVAQDKTNAITEQFSSLEDTEDSIYRLKLLIASIRFRYNIIAKDLVSIDAQGLHMATQTPCHTFFGEMLIKLQKDLENVSVPSFIQKILNTFCGRGAVDSEYCKKMQK